MQQNFEEEFTEFKGVERFHNYDFGFEMLSEKSIQKHGLPKKRVSDAIGKMITHRHAQEKNKHIYTYSNDELNNQFISELEQLKEGLGRK